MARDSECILEMSIMNVWEKGQVIVFATEASLGVLLRHGMELVYVDGTHNLDYNSKIQVVPITVSHKEAKKVIFSFK